MGPGAKTQDFGREMPRASLGHVEMGRHALRITAGLADGPVSLDGFWITETEQDLVNRVDAQGRIIPPAKLHMLVYPYGPVNLNGINFHLADPAENGGKGILLGKPNSEYTVACEGKRGTRLRILGAGLTTDAATVKVTVKYADATAKTQEMRFGALFTQTPESPLICLGHVRYAYLGTVDLDDKPLRQVVFEKGASRYVILAATVESAASAKP